MKKISIFGSTGSIGISAINFLKAYKDQWSFFALTANDNVELLIKQAKDLKPEYAVIGNVNLYQRLRQGLSNTDIKIEAGYNNINNIAQTKCDIILMAIMGIAALRPTIEAIKSGSNIALANKEAIVCAGEIITDLSIKHNIKILPVDSEHNAIFQLINKTPINNIDKIYLTASGGPFRKYSLKDMENITIEQALNHPNWKMGRKITVDSATMVNKSLELIEAHYLFNLPSSKIDIIVHPQSIIHGMVDLIDGTILASMNVPDMTSSISYALNYPNRAHTKVEKLNFIDLVSLNFEKLNLDIFRSVTVARNCLESEEKPLDCIIFNSANEIAVEAFLNGKIKFLDIINIIETCLNNKKPQSPKSIEDIYHIDSEIRKKAQSIINNFYLK